MDVINPLTVVDDGGKLIRILDWRYIDSYPSVSRLKFDGICIQLEIMSSSLHGYHQIDILGVQQGYPSSSWQVDRKTWYLALTVLVFGLATAPFVYDYMLLLTKSKVRMRKYLL